MLGKDMVKIGDVNFVIVDQKEVYIMSKKVLAISDLHVGDETSIMPPEVVLDKGGSFRPNKLQRKLYKKWEQMCDDVGIVDVLAVVGDTCEGVHRKNKGLGCWTTDLKVQIQTAQHLLGMVKARKIIGVQGSIYHVEENMSSDRVVIEGIGGEFDDDLKLTFKDIKKSFHFSHKIGVSRSVWMYRSTPIAREMLLAELDKEQYGKMDVIVRGHTHYYWLCSSGNHYGVILPAWKGRDAYVKRLSLAFNPHLGYVMFTADKEGIDVQANLWKLKGRDAITEVVV